MQMWVRISVACGAVATIAYYYSRKRCAVYAKSASASEEENVLLDSADLGQMRVLCKVSPWMGLLGNACSSDSGHISRHRINQVQLKFLNAQTIQ